MCIPGGSSSVGGFPVEVRGVGILESVEVVAAVDGADRIVAVVAGIVVKRMVRMIKGIESLGIFLILMYMSCPHKKKEE